MKKWFVVILLPFCVFLLSSTVFAQGKAKKPNVVLFIADDASYHDFGCWGNKDVKTPNIDRLAEQGMRLTNFYSPATVCSPLRQTLLTGMYSVRNGAYPNHSRVYPEVRSLPYFLGERGYKTICVGKQHFYPVSCYPFDRTIGMIGEDEKKKEGKEKKGETHFEKLENFITKNPNKPFCAYIASNEPHHPWTEGDPGIYDADSLTLPPYLVDTPETRNGLKNYYGEITHLDGQVGRVMELLEKTGHVDDTIFFFFSEQGSNFPHAKWCLYDAGVRVAAVVRWPEKIKSSSESATLVQYVDVLPTLIELAGGDPTACETGRPDAHGHTGFDGKSFKESLLGNDVRIRDYAFAQHTSRGIYSGPPAYASRMVTDGRWKLIWNIHHDKEFKNTAIELKFYKSWLKKAAAGDDFAKKRTESYIKRPQWELYDLKSDPWELTNVADKPENEEVLSRLKIELEKWMRQQGDLGDETEMKANERSRNAASKSL